MDQSLLMGVCYFQSKNALLSTFLFLDQIVWLGRSGIYKVREIKSVHHWSIEVSCFG